MKRMSSGNPELDKVLHGGFPVNSMNVITGLPGTGKTVLLQSMVFTNATPERPALYVSTVSEPLDKMLRYVQGMSFFDEEKVATSVFYEDLGDTLRTEGLEATIARIIELLKEYRPAILVIDSFKALHAFGGSARAFRSALAELATALTSLAVTSFLVGENSAREAEMLPEFSVADGILELVLAKRGVTDARYMRVVKLRGSSYSSGEHAYRIGPGGIKVFPRLTTPDHLHWYETKHERAQTGVQLLDSMVAEGFWRGSSTVVFGPPGSGKTLLGLHFIFKGIELGEKAVIGSLQENPTQLARVASSFGWDLEKMISDGDLSLMYVSPVEVGIDEFVWRLTREADALDASRILVDSLNDLSAASPSEDRFRDYLYALVQQMALAGRSLFMTQEVRDLFATTVLSEAGISHMSDNVILLNYLRSGSAIQRAISVIKTRGSDHDPTIRQFEIASEGLVIGEPFSGSPFGDR